MDFRITEIVRDSSNKIDYVRGTLRGFPLTVLKFKLDTLNMYIDNGRITPSNFIISSNDVVLNK